MDLGVRVVGTYHSSPADIAGVEWHRLDVADRDAVGRLVASVRPDAVISTVYGVAAVSWPANVLGAIHVATAVQRLGARLVHVSSDAVHSGSPEPLTEADLPNPVYPYGAAKAAAEIGVALVAPGAAIVRISLIHSDPDGELSQRERLMLDLAAGRTTGVLFTDELRCPIAVTDVASALIELAVGEAGGGTTEAAAFAGVLNLAGPDAISFYDLGVLVARKHGLDPANLPAGRSGGLGRPEQVRLDCTLATSLLRTRLRGIRELA
jgi:dTDP-4-dehydrorhamnose reductase